MTEMGALIAPEYRPAFGSRPVFVQPRNVPLTIWNAAVEEVMADCPAPPGLWDNEEPWVIRPNPIGTGSAWR